VYINDEKQGSFFTTAGRTMATYDWQAPADENIVLKFTLANDGIDILKKEDRNAFIYATMIERVGDR
jgi:hypothetical protein